MVTRKELTGFKQTLTTALQKAGYTAFGRISSSEEVYNTYAHLPEQEMAAAYVVDNNLDEINKVYRVIKFISENSGNYYSLRKLCKEHDVDYKVFTHAVENLPYIDKTGERRKTQYHWIYEQEPSFKTAKAIVEHMQKLKSTRLNKRLKAKISRAVAEGVNKDEFFEASNIKKEATYSAEAYYNYQKVQQQKKDEQEDLSDTLPDNIAQPEAPSLTAEQEPQEQEILEKESSFEESVLKDEEIQAEPEPLDEAGLEMENYILRQEIKYLKKINKAKDKLIKALRRKV